MTSPPGVTPVHWMEQAQWQVANKNRTGGESRIRRRFCHSAYHSVRGSLRPFTRAAQTEAQAG